MTTELFLQLFANDYGFIDNVSILIFYNITLIWFILILFFVNAKSWLIFPCVLFLLCLFFGFSTTIPENVPIYGTKAQKEKMVYCVNWYKQKYQKQTADITNKNIDFIMKQCYKADKEKLAQENNTKTRIFQKELDKMMNNQGYSN